MTLCFNSFFLVPHFSPFPPFFFLTKFMSEISISATDNPLLHSKEKLIKLYGIDLFAAASSSAMVAPFIAIVDR